MLEKTLIYTANTDSYHLYRIPGLLVTPRGVVLATAEARRGRGGDWDANDVVMRRSLDGGITWEPSRLVIGQQQYGEGPISNFVMIGDRHDAAVHALYCHNYARVFYMRSDCDGTSFSASVDITATVEAFRRHYPWRVIATGPDHGLQLRNGRLIVPLWMSDGTGTEFGPGKLGHRPSVVSLIYSDDHGQTWRCGDIVVRNEQRRNPSETIAVELADGRVLFNIRSEAGEHQRLISISPDGVSNWSTPQFDDALLEPVCMASIIRYNWPGPNRRSRVLFANPDTLERTFANWAPSCDRKRLAVKLSYDECRTWPVSKILEPGSAGYSDLAVLPDGTILCFYESGTLAGTRDERGLTLARFDLAWMTDGRDSGQD
ncbi:MAG: glycoside hydrolase [Chloroflexi bacterium]|nr:glycoside hydrolase [Chloroflexota bacterium]